MTMSVCSYNHRPGETKLYEPHQMTMFTYSSIDQEKESIGERELYEP